MAFYDRSKHSLSEFRKPYVVDDAAEGQKLQE